MAFGDGAQNWEILEPGEPIYDRNIFRLICHPANLKEIRNIRECETVVLKYVSGNYNLALGMLVTYLCIIFYLVWEDEES